MVGERPFTVGYKPRPNAYSFLNYPEVRVDRIWRTHYFTFHRPPNKDIYRKQKYHR